MKKTVFWFRNDLRLEDNPSLSDALSTSDEIAFIYVHDPRLWRPSSTGLPRLGWHRRRFLHESLVALRMELEKLGYQLNELWGHPEVVIPQMIASEGFNHLCFSREAAPAEASIEAELHIKSHDRQFTIQSHWTHSLLDHEANPLVFAQTPQTFTQFRKQVESVLLESLIPKLCYRQDGHRPRHKRIFREFGSTNTALLALSSENRRTNGESTGHAVEGSWWEASQEELHALRRIEKPNAPAEKMRVLRGGSQAGLRRIDDYLFGTHSVSNYFETRNGMLNPNDSTLFSAWLANGCVSPRQIFWALKEYEQHHGSNKSTYWVVFELLWREFFQRHLRESGERFFHPEGLYRVPQNTPTDSAQQKEAMSRSLHCNTDQSFIDAHLRELIQTGFMSNRGRQNVASFLIYHMGIHWTHVASLFETFLMDYDAASNWGNCAYIAGVSFDPRGGRIFNIEKQQKDYDPLGEYVRAWN